VAVLYQMLSIHQYVDLDAGGELLPCRLIIRYQAGHVIDGLARKPFPVVRALVVVPCVRQFVRDD